MGRILFLIAGDFQRTIKYNILAATFFVTIIWAGVLHFTEIKDVTSFFPLLVFIDVTSMAVLFVGVSMFFEKQEGSIKSILISPVSKFEYIISKALVNMFLNVLVLILLYIYAVLFKEIDINIIGLTASVMLVSFLHSMIGFIITYYSKSFTDVLMGMMKYSLITMTPVLLEYMGIIKSDILKYIIKVLPTKASLDLLTAGPEQLSTATVTFNVVFLVVLCGFLYFVVSKKFDEFAVKESGV